MSEPIFTQRDYAAVRKAMAELSEKEMKIVFLRFWGPYSLYEIGRFLGMSYDSVDGKLKKALLKLKKHCLMTPSFSRSFFTEFSTHHFELHCSTLEL